MTGQIHAVFVKGAYRYPHNWDTICKTLASYNVNEMHTQLSLGWATRNGVPELLAGDGPELATINQLAHDYGMKHSIVLTVMGSPGWSPEHDAWRVLDSTLTPQAWNCPVKQEIRLALANLITELIRTYNVDGIVLDYVRFKNNDMCYCNDCRTEFEQVHGSVVPNWTADVAEGGALRQEFLEWRHTTVTRIIAEAYNVAKSINPKTVVSSSVYGVPLWNVPRDFWKYEIGQDTIAFAEILDYISPMLYLTNERWWDSEAGEYRPKFHIAIERAYKYIVFEDRSKLKPYLQVAGPETGWVGQDLETFQDQMTLSTSVWGTGCGIWRYYGPGFEETGTTPPDIRPYLELLPELAPPQPSIPLGLFASLVGLILIKWGMSK